MPYCLKHVLLWVLVQLPITWIMCRCKHTCMFLPMATQFSRVKVRLFFSSKPLLWKGQNHSDTVSSLSSFYPSPCVSFLHVLITPRPFTLTVSNGIACRGHWTRSRSCKCTAHVCTNSPIDASLAPMSGRIEPSAVLSVRALSQFLKSPWNWAETHIWTAQLLYSIATGFFFTCFYQKQKYSYVCI